MIEIPRKPLVFLVYDPAEETFATHLGRILAAYGIIILGTDGQDMTLDPTYLLKQALELADAVIFLAPSEQLRKFSLFSEEVNVVLADTRKGFGEPLASLIQILEAMGFSPALRIGINEDPLTVHNLSAILSALTDLSTKYWLIAKRRFSDLVEYSQTHNERFADDAQIVITSINYNSPFNMDWKVDLSAPSVAEALVTTIDGIVQRKERLEKIQLENQAQAQGIRDAEQKSEQENQMALLEQEKQRLEIEQRRLEVIEKQLEVQKKSIETALELAGKIADTLQPDVDAAARAMIIQTLLPNIIQLQNGKGLNLGWFISAQ